MNLVVLIVLLVECGGDEVGNEAVGVGAASG